MLNHHNGVSLIRNCQPPGLMLLQFFVSSLYIGLLDQLLKFCCQKIKVDAGSKMLEGRGGGEAEFRRTTSGVSCLFPAV